MPYISRCSAFFLCPFWAFLVPFPKKLPKNLPKKSPLFGVGCRLCPEATLVTDKSHLGFIMSLFSKNAQGAKSAKAQVKNQVKVAAAEAEVKDVRKARTSRKEKVLEKTTFPCIDLKVEGFKPLIEEKHSRRGTLVCDSLDHFTFREKGLPYVPHPHLHWRLLDRTRHGRMNINAEHVKVEFYIRHEDYKDGFDLADLLASEIETMGEHMCDIDFDAEVEKCLDAFLNVEC